MPPEEKTLLWQKQARELGGDSLVEVIEGMGGDITLMKSRLDKLDSHILRAFPEGDVDGHREYHKIMIERNREIRSLKRAIREKTIVGLLYSAGMFVGWCILEGIKKKIWG